MSEENEFPFEIKDVMPIAQIMARTTKHFENFSKFFENETFPPGFPIYSEIPLKYTVSAQYEFIKAERKDMDLSLFEIPKDYEFVEEKEKKQKESKTKPEKETDKEKEKTEKEINEEKPSEKEIETREVENTE